MKKQEGYMITPRFLGQLLGSRKGDIKGVVKRGGGGGGRGAGMVAEWRTGRDRGDMDLVWKIFEIKMPVRHPGEVQQAAGQMGTVVRER